MRLRPMPALAQLPAVDDVADEIDRVGVVVPEKIKKKMRLGCFRAKVQIGQKKRAIAALGRLGCVVDPATPFRSGVSGIIARPRPRRGSARCLPP